MTNPMTTPIAPGVRRVAVIGALALSVLGISVPAASAGQPEWIDTKGGFLEFQDRGEVLVVKDEKHDGRDVIARASWVEKGDGWFDEDKSRVAAVRASSTRGKSTDSRKLSIPEGTKVKLQMCYTKKDGTEDGTACSGFQSARA